MIPPPISTPASCVNKGLLITKLKTAEGFLRFYLFLQLFNFSLQRANALLLFAKLKKHDNGGKQNTYGY